MGYRVDFMKPMEPAHMHASDKGSDEHRQELNEKEKS